MSDAMIVDGIETCVCGGCNEEIRPEHIIKRIDRKTGVRTIRAHCDPCNVGWELKQALRNGQWVNIGAVAVMDDRARAALVNELGKVRREIQRQTARQRKRIDRAFADRIAQDESQPEREFSDVH